MKQTIYILPGFGETCSEVRYKNLATVLKAKGYIVKRVKPDWYKALSLNVFKPEKNSILVGFSFGAVIAYLIAKKYDVAKVIFCSLSPIGVMTWSELREDYRAHMNGLLADENATDIKKIVISLKTLTMPYWSLAGEKETGIQADLLVPKSGHFITKRYIRAVAKLI